MKKLITKIGLFYRTIRYLKFVQIYRRIWFKFYRPRITSSLLPAVKDFHGLKTTPAKKKVSLSGPSEWILLNERGKLDEIGWHNSLRSKLWRYNQHYFDDLNAIGSQCRVNWHERLMDQWIKENPPFLGHGWEPYPTSIRIINWIKWSAQGGLLSKSAEESLAMQVRWLRRRLEWHLLGNHLFMNAKALVFAGLYFGGSEAREWLTHGMRIIKGQIAEQILPDGAQFELSPMYHALATEDLLDLINVCEVNAGKIASEYMQSIAEWRVLAERMLGWLVNMSHQDSEISFFNDSAFEVAPINQELYSYAKRLDILVSEPQIGITNLKDSGYVRLQSENAVLIADLGPIGPDYLPGHAHADTLSFELSVFGSRICVNSGTSEYGISAERHRQRGTLSHNTVCVVNQDSSEVWSGFRVGARAKITRKCLQDDGAVLHAYGEHNGYARINRELRHSRKFTLEKSSLRIVDNVSLPLNASARYHFHPDLFVAISGENHGVIITKNGKKMKWIVSNASSIELVPTTWHPEFGKVVPNKCLVVNFNNQVCSLNLMWG